MSIVDAIWREIATPSDQRGPLDAAYRRAVIGIGHAVLGAALVALVPSEWWLAPFVVRTAVAVGYWLVKEWGDLTRGGGVRDGIEDAAFVWLGGWYGEPWWPALVLACAGYAMVAGAMAEGRR